jgi:hypothetical protein
MTSILRRGAKQFRLFRNSVLAVSDDAWSAFELVKVHSMMRLLSSARRESLPWRPACDYNSFDGESIRNSHGISDERSSFAGRTSDWVFSR